MEQHTVAARRRRLRPDVIVHLPGGKHVVIDAKAPLDAYLRALEAPDEATRQALLADHARQVRAHLTQLAAKGYAAHVHPSPDFVVMFLPGEMFFSAALEQDPSLIEFGVGHEARHPGEPDDADRAAAGGGVRLAAGGDGGDAQQIGEPGASCTRRSASSAAISTTLGTKLQGSLDAYNDAVGSLEGNVLVKARKFKELQAANGGEDIKALEPIDRVPRMLQAAELTDGLPFVDA